MKAKLPNENQNIKFLNQQRGYFLSDPLIAELEFDPSFKPCQNDWIAIMPAGFPNISFFCALKSLPILQENKNDIENDDANKIVDELFQLMPKFQKQKQEMNKQKLKVVFCPREAKLTPNNFYQFAYVQKSTRQILSYSSVFYVESFPNFIKPRSQFQPFKNHSMTREAAAFLSQKRHGWRSFLCTSGTKENQWLDRTSTYILPEQSEIDEDFEDEEYLSKNNIEKKRLISTTDDDGFEDEDKKEKPKSSITQFLLDLWRQPFSAPSGNYGLYSGIDEKRSSSMYEIGTNYVNSTNEPYQKMVCQLTHSNNNLLHENERLHHHIQQIELTMRNTIEQLNSVYYTLFRNGISTINYPNGEQLHLNQFRGKLLNFGKSDENIQRETLTKINNVIPKIREKKILEKTNDLSSESSSSGNGSVDQDELKTVMLKCITKSKYNNDLDDFVNWLNDSNVHSARFENERKSRSLEEHMQESLRIRQPLQRLACVDRTRSESELTEGSSPTETSSSNSVQRQESFNRQQANGSIKSKTLRMRAQSVAVGKANTIFGSRRTNSIVRQNIEQRNNSQRKSLANLASLRTSNNRQPRRNLI